MQHAIIQIVNQMAFSADNRDWTTCRQCFANNVMVDYTSMAGGDPATIPADALIESWEGLLPGFDATQHLLGSHIVSMNEQGATCLAHFQATHIIDSETWTLGGKYTFELEQQNGNWVITAITMTALWSVGDQSKLLGLATERAKV